MTVRELVDLLKTQPQDLPVAYACCSEWRLLDSEDIETKMLQPARADGWIHSDWGKEELATVEYLTFPGN